MHSVLSSGTGTVPGSKADTVLPPEVCRKEDLDDIAQVYFVAGSGRTSLPN